MVLERANIVLTGFMAAGKSTVGRLVAEITGMELVDTDASVEEAAGMTVEEIFEVWGEPRFRELEGEAVRRASGRSGAVISAGGGAALDEENRRALARVGVVYFLDVTSEEALRRAGNATARPLLGSRPEAVEKLIRERRPAYLEAADVVIDTSGRTVEEVSEMIAADFAKRSG